MIYCIPGVFIEHLVYSIVDFRCPTIVLGYLLAIPEYPS